MPRHPFSPSFLAASVFCAATPALAALQPIAEAPLAGETEFRCQFNADNSTDCVSTYSFTILKPSGREMLSRIDRSYAETDSLIVEKAELTQPGGKPVPLDQSQIDTRTAPNPDQGFLRERQTSLAFPNLRVGTRISYTLREHFTAKPLSTQFHYILSRPPMPVRDDRFVAEFKAERPIFVRSELMDAYRIEQSADKKTLKVSLKKPQYTNYINEAGNAYLRHTPRLELGSSLDLQDNFGPFAARYNEILAAELPKGAAAAVAAVKGKPAREQVAGLMQYINDTYRYLGDWRASERGYVPFSWRRSSAMATATARTWRSSSPPCSRPPGSRPNRPWSAAATWSGTCWCPACTRRTMPSSAPRWTARPGGWTRPTRCSLPAAPCPTSSSAGRWCWAPTARCGATRFPWKRPATPCA